MIAFILPSLSMSVAFGVLMVDNGCRAFVLPATNSRPAFLNIGSSSSYNGITSLSISSASSSSRLFSTPDNEDDSTPDQEGASMAAQFFQMAQAKGVTLDDDDLLDEDDDDDDEEDYEVENTVDDDDDDDEDDDEEPNIPQGAVDAFLDKKLTDDRLYSEVKERVLDTAGGFVDMVRGPSDDDDEDDEYGDGDDTNKPYVPPLTVPDSELTAGEVVLLVLDALKNNDNPTMNKGVDILFGYSSSGSQIKNEEGLTPKEYGEFLKETEYKALFEHINVVSFLFNTVHTV
ncbi:MAG: hypothetical protein ACI8RD_013152 [Bacillariaceae sp.]|jgi:hypothetical protein